MDFFRNIFNVGARKNVINDIPEKNSDELYNTDKSVQSINDIPIHEAVEPIKTDPIDYSEYLRKANNDIDFLNDTYKLNRNIRVLNSDPENNKSHIIISILGHGDVIHNDPLPPDLCNNTLCWSLATPNGTGLTYSTNVNTVESKDTGFQDVISNYAAIQLRRNFPILNVLNHLRQLFTKTMFSKTNPLPRQYGSLSAETVLRDYNSTRIGFSNEKIQAHENALNDAFNARRDVRNDIYRPELLNEISDDLARELVTNEMLSKNKFAYIHVPEKNMNYISDIIYYRNRAPVYNIELKVCILDVRYPKNETQDSLYSYRKRSFLSITHKISKTNNFPDGSYKEETTLAEILTYLKGTLNFDYVTIIETTCRDQEIDVSNHTITDPDIAIPDKKPLYKATADYYAKARSKANKYMERVNYRSFGGSKRRRRRRTTRAARCGTKRRRSSGTSHRATRRK